MLDGVFYLLIFFLFAGIAALGLWISCQNTGIDPTKLLPKKQDRRLTLVEARYLDNKRKMILVRRDNVEHLILTGGPVDILLESGIPAPSNSEHGVSNTTASKDSERTDKSESAHSIPQNGMHSSIPAPVPKVVSQD
ncbi:MAG: flagellar biosynthetic protein FliO [Hyphomicrobiales bacterium]|nr:flagellar biosynthetic protein FliO [Hyphomicrobiales bacterium]